jgi:hypothetical protein
MKEARVVRVGRVLLTRLVKLHTKDTITNQKHI